MQIEEQAREIAVSMKSKEKSEAQALAEDARAKMLEAQERAHTLRDTEIANRQKTIELLEAQKVADAEAARMRILAEAEKGAAEDLAEADRIAVAALAERLQVEADGAQKLNEAENTRSDANRRSGMHKALVSNLPAIIRESVKPMEKIDSIKVVHLGGAGIGEGGGARSPTDEVMDSVLRYRVQAPMIEELLKDVGVDGANLTRAGDIFRSAKDAKSLMPDPGKSGPEKKDG